jgi:hypothetical protein
MTRLLLTMGRTNVATLSVSNIGSVDHLFSYDAFKVSGVHVHSALSGIGSTLAVGLTTCSGKLFVDMTYLQNLLTETQVFAIEAETRDTLESYSAGNSLSQFKESSCVANKQLLET